MSTPQYISRSKTRRSNRQSKRALLFHTLLCAAVAVVIQACSTSTPNYSQSPTRQTTFSQSALAPTFNQNAGFRYSETRAIEPGTEVVVLHRDYYAGETSYSYTRGTFEGWGEPLVGVPAVYARVQHLESKHDINHPLSLYRDENASQLRASTHYASMNIVPVDASTGLQTINMDHVVAIIPADAANSIVAQRNTSNNGFATNSATNAVPNSTTAIGSAGRTASVPSGTIGSAGRTTSRGPSSIGATSSAGRSTGSSGRSSSGGVSSAGRSSGGGYDCPLQPRSGGSRGVSAVPSGGSSGSSRGSSSGVSTPRSSGGSTSAGTVTSSTTKKTGGTSYPPR